MPILSSFLWPHFCYHTFVTSYPCAFTAAVHVRRLPSVPMDTWPRGRREKWPGIHCLHIKEHSLHSDGCCLSV